MSGLIEDLHHAWRVHRRTPLQSGLAVLTLAVAIAFATAFFSLYSDLALKPLPGVENSRELATLGLSEGDSFDMLRIGIIDRLRERATALEAVEATGYADLDVSAPRSLDSRTVGMVTPGFFDEMGIRLAQGRGLRPGDTDAGVVVVSDTLAKELFGNAENALNQEVVFNEEQATVIGVTEPGFDGLMRNRRESAWMSRRFVLREVWGAPDEFLEKLPVQGFARVRPGVSVAAASREISDIVDGLPESLRQGMRAQSVRISPQLSPDPASYRNTTRQLKLMVGAATLVCLVAAGNLGLFLLARVPGRRREMALRMSLGATRSRLARQLIVEAAMLVVIGTLLGAILSVWLGAYLQQMPLFSGGSYLGQGLDWRVPLFGLVCAGLLSGLVGLVPVVGLSRDQLMGETDKGASHHFSRHVIAGLQVLIAVVIVAGGFYAQYSLVAVMHADTGYKADNVNVVEVAIDDSVTGFGFDSERVEALRQGIREKLGSAANIRQLGFSGMTPGKADVLLEAVAPHGRMEDATPSIVTGWDSEVFDSLAIDVLDGRLPSPDATSEVVVNVDLAERLWGRRDVVGEILERASNSYAGNQGSNTMEIVGVIPDIRFGHPRESVRPTVIRGGATGSFMADLIVQGRMSRDQAIESLSDYLADHSPPLRIKAVRDLVEIRNELFAADRSRAMLTGLGAGIVLVMAVLGFYGTLRFLMESQRFEFALRSALGAGPSSLYRETLQRGLVLAAPGLLLGIPASIIVLTPLQSSLGGGDLSVLPASVIAPCLLTIALILAIHPVAKQASSRDPGPILKQD